MRHYLSASSSPIVAVAAGSAQPRLRTNPDTVESWSSRCRPSRRPTTPIARRRSGSSTRSLPTTTPCCGPTPTTPRRLQDRRRPRRVVDDLEGRPHLHLEAPARRQVPRRQRDDLEGRQGVSYDKIIFPPAGVASDRQGRIRSTWRPCRRRIRTRSCSGSSGRPASFLMSLASPWNWIYKADILAKDMRWYETNVMGTGPLRLRRARAAARTGSARRTRTTGTRASRTWTATGRCSSSDSAAQVAGGAGRARAHPVPRLLAPPERDSLVQALGPKITVQESPWNCVHPGRASITSKKPFDDKRVRKRTRRSPSIVTRAPRRCRRSPS